MTLRISKLRQWEHPAQLLKQRVRLKFVTCSFTHSVVLVLTGRPQNSGSNKVNVYFPLAGSPRVGGRSGQCHGPLRRMSLSGCELWCRPSHYF